MSLSPSGVAAQLTALVATYGETITLDRGGVNRTVQMFLEPANAAVISTYFDDNDAVGLIRPTVQVFFDATMSGTSGTLGAPQILDTFTRDGRSFTVQKVQFHRLSSTVILITCLCD